MEWIKEKYDRLLLGVFGVIALLVGGLLVMKVFGFKGQFPRETPPVLRSDFGKEQEEKQAKQVKDAKEHLAVPAEFKPKVKDGKEISLFTSAPVIKLENGDTIAILDPQAKQVRPPIDNRWAFENGLNLQRMDMATHDPDLDGFNNTEEFLAKTKPLDKSSTPGIASKVEYKEVVKDPLTLRINTWNDTDKEIQFRRTEPADKAFNTPNLKEGATFPIERGGEPRFKIEKVVPPSGTKRVTAILTDLTAKKPEKIELEQGKLLEMPSRRAKLVCKLGKEEEKIVSEAEEFTFTADPSTNFKVLAITDDEVTLEIAAPNQEKINKTFKIPPPP
jgi:hypothetical protein